MAVMLKGHNMPGWCACCTPERAEGQGPARRSLRRQVRKRENREWRKEAEREIRESYYYDEDDIDEYVEDDMDHFEDWLTNLYSDDPFFTEPDLVGVGSPVWDREGEI